MRAERRGRAQLNYLLLASLLLHLALVFALVSGYRPEALPRTQVSGMVLEYLEPGAKEGALRVESRLSAASVPAALDRNRKAAPAGMFAPAGQAAVPRLDLRRQEPRPGASLAASPTAVGSRSQEAAGAGAGAGNLSKEAALAGTVSLVSGGAGKPPITTGAGKQPSTDGAGASKNGAAGTATSASAATETGGAGTVFATATRNQGAPGAALRGAGPFSPARGAYQARLKSLVEAHKQYPLAARRSGREGSCERRFVLGRDGSLKRVEALSSCGHPFLDGAATQAITGVGRFPPLPEEYPGGEESFTITMTFTLTAR